MQQTKYMSKYNTKMAMRMALLRFI